MFFRTDEDKKTTNSAPKSEQKKVNKFRISLICRTSWSNSGFLSWLRNYSCIHARRKLIYSGLRTLLFEFFDANFTESKSNLSLVFVPAGLPGVCGQVTCRAGVFSNGSQIEFFFLHFQIVNLLELFFESLLELPCFPASYLLIFLFLQSLQVPGQAGKHILLFTQ